MDNFVFVALILGLAGGVAATIFFYQQKTRRQITDQSVVILDKIKQMCTLITVEGEFSEIFTHREGRKIFFNLLQMEKKALIIIKAKVHIGFDLTQINIETDPVQKVVKLSKFPSPEIVSIETDLEYYDIQKGIIDKLSVSDLTKINKRSKEFIRGKVYDSQLIKIARNQADDTISVLHQLVDSTGWKLITENLPDKIDEKKKLKK